MVYTHLRKESFRRRTYNKLKLKKYVLCRILKKILDNAYVLEIPEEFEISSTFNVVELYRYEEGLTSGEE